MRLPFGLGRSSATSAQGAAAATEATAKAASRTGEQLGRMGGDLKGLGTNARNAFTTTFSTARDSAGRFTGVAARTADTVGKWAVATARLPVKIASGTFNRFPKLSAVAVVAGGAMVVGGAVKRRTERRTREDALNRAAEAQAMAQANATSYMNTVDPQTSAILDERLGQGGRGPGQSHAAAIEAQRAAAVQQAPATPAV